jgi:hypothetical protein
LRAERKFFDGCGRDRLEIKPDANDYPGALPHMLKAGSLVFTPPKHAVDLSDWGQWWSFKFGADQRRPYGPRSSISGLDDQFPIWAEIDDGGRAQRQHFTDPALPLPSNVDTPESLSPRTRAALIHERHRLRAAHVAGFESIELETGAFDQRCDRAIEMAATP